MAIFVWEQNIENVTTRHSTGFQKTGQIIEAHRAYIRPKITLLIWLLMGLLILIIGSIAVGSYDMPLIKIIRTVLGWEEGPHRIVVWGIRMPRIMAAIITGCGLGLSGLATQGLLRNLLHPLLLWASARALPLEPLFQSLCWARQGCSRAP